MAAMGVTSVEAQTDHSRLGPREALRRRGSDQQLVLHVTWSFVAGGSEKYAFTVATHLNQAKYKSAMCALDQGGALEPEIARCGIPRFVMHRQPGIQPRLMWTLYRLFRDIEVD